MKLAIVAGVLGVAACATARPPPLAPPLDTLAFYVGEWQCRGTTFATKDQPEAHWDAQVIVAPALDGSWLSVQMIGPGANRTIEHKGYDPATKQWVHLAVGPAGSWGTVTSPGWTGAQMVFEDAREHTRATFTRIDEHHYSHAVANDAAHGGERLWEKVCFKG